jgi:hypothetical protein
VHKRIWRVAEATVEDALASLSRQETAQLVKLLARVKGSLVAVVDNGGAAKASNGARVAGSQASPRRGRRQNGSAAP